MPFNHEDKFFEHSIEQRTIDASIDQWRPNELFANKNYFDILASETLTFGQGYSKFNRLVLGARFTKDLKTILGSS